MRNVKKFSRFLSFILIFAISASYLGNTAVFAAFEPDETVYSEGIYMVNLDTDIAVYSKNATARYYPASTTKIMTCIIAMENCSNLDDYVKITYDATNEFWEGDPNKEGPSNAALEAGQTNITYRDCVYALMIASACEAANILAINIAGSIENFVAMMNDKAKALGCVDTHFSNTHGLWEANNYSTPYDMYLISKYAYEKIAGFMEICDTYQYTLPPNEYNPDGYIKTSTNVLLRNSSDNEFYYEYAHGIKTGSIDYYWDADGEKHEGGRCLVSTAKKDGFSYMVVSMQAPYFDENGESYNYAALDHLTLYKWAFSTFSYVTVLSENDVIREVAVEQGDGADHIQLVPATAYSTLLPGDLDMSTIQKIVETQGDLVAPVEKGTILGTVELKLGGETLTKINLVAASTVERSQIAYVTEQVKSIIDTTWFKCCAALLVAMIITLVVLNSIRRSRLEKAARRNTRKNNYRQ